MPHTAEMPSQMLEFHRYGGSNGVLLSCDHRYIRTSGTDGDVRTVQSRLSHEEFLEELLKLRYPGDGQPQDPQQAIACLADAAFEFLEPPSLAVDGLSQIDLVTHAAELWAFAFEACYGTRADWLGSADQGVVLTRRVRAGFSATVPRWPTVPRVLFAHAREADDLEPELIERHQKALWKALEPWWGIVPDDDLLRVESVGDAAALRAKREEFKPNYVHLLAHGAPTRPRLGSREKVLWGLRLGLRGSAGIHPSEVAPALGVQQGLPVVVTIAACDGANQTDVRFSDVSLVHQLHRDGVPVTIGSQLPFTKEGSVVFTEAFYAHVLRGEDVRAALHAGRVALKRSEPAGHDWLSLVAYVRLPPEGYGRYLAEFGLSAELGMLNAAQKRADKLAAAGEVNSDFEPVCRRVEDRIASLERRRQTLDVDNHRLQDECDGLLGSASKRLAELLFVRSRLGGPGAESDRLRSNEALCTALGHYRRAFRQRVHNHWQGVQQIALEAVLLGRLEKPADWHVALRAAELAQEADETDYWASGSLAELWLLAPLAGVERSIDKAQEALRTLIARAGDRTDGAQSTARQLRRYTAWWTPDNGFFPGTDDLSADAGTLLGLLPPG